MVTEMLVFRLRHHGFRFTHNGQPLKLGELFHARGQAEVLRRVAKEGPDAFYRGEVAADMLSALKAMGGVHTSEDFASMRAEYVEPISAEYRDGYELVELPPNGQGVTALLLAKILSHFDLSSMDPFGAQRAHVEAEAAKLAFRRGNKLISY